MPRKILFIDDDVRIQDLLRDYFKRNSFELTPCLTGPQGIAQLKQTQFDVVILDVMLPEMDGFETLQEIRTFSDIPVIMVTAGEDETDRIVGLEVGADDYMHKPFNPRELLARIKAVLRRTQKTKETPQAIMNADPEAIESNGLILNPARRRVSLGDKEIDLSTVEFDILYALVSSRGRVVSRDQLMTLARGREFEAFDRSVDVHVSRIRKKIEQNPSKPARIKTIWGKGYLWADD